MKPEDFIAERGRPFTGAEYIASLRDEREVHINGKRVADVTTHPAFRNSIRSIARLYDALHDPASKGILTCETDTGSGGYTHRFFRPARTREDLVGQQRAIAEWARMTYGWMGRTPDYKASLCNTLGPNADHYGPYADNARAWHKRAQESVLFMNHALGNPPVDRSSPIDQVKDVYVTIQKETDAGLIVSGAKMVATSGAITHYNFVGQTTPTRDPDLSAAFILPMNAPGVKLLCRTSYEQAARSPFDNPLSSRFDENDAILVLDRVLIPWENVLLHRQPEKVIEFFSGFLNGFSFHGCTRFAVKLDFISGLLDRALSLTGGIGFRGNQVMLGEVLGYRHLFWSLSDCMANLPEPWVEGAVLPNFQAAQSYRLFAPDAYSKVIEIIERVVPSALVYIPSSAEDLSDPETSSLLAKYARGSNGLDYKARIKTLKLLWEAVGSEFAGRHILYERNYSGTHDDVRLQNLYFARHRGTTSEMERLSEKCMADYDEKGWAPGTSWLDRDADA